MTDAVCLSKQEAQRVLLHSQGLWPHLGRQLASVEAAVDQLAGVQYDPNPQISQNHYLVLWNRLAGFAESDLDEALYRRYTVIEGNFMRRNMFLVPTQQFHVYRQATRSVARWGISIRQVEAEAEGNPMAREAQRSVEGCLRKFGPLTRGQIFDRLGWSEGYRIAVERSRRGGSTPTEEWVHTPLGALRLLQWRGDVVTCGRAPGSFRQPIYHLRSELPVCVDLGEAPDEPTARTMLVRNMIRAYGVTRASHLAVVTGFSVRECECMLDILTQENQGVVRAVVEGDKKWWAWADAVQAAATQTEGKPSAEDVALLPPLDNAVRDRKFLQKLFGYTFSFEYFRKRDMKWQLSVLLGGRFLGYADCKAERSRRRFHVRELQLAEPAVAVQAMVRQRLEQLAAYHGCTELTHG